MEKFKRFVSYYAVQRHVLHGYVLCAYFISYRPAFSVACKVFDG